MATLTKSTARKPLAEGNISTGWSNFRDQGEMFNVSLAGHRLNLTRRETESLVSALRQQLEDPALRAAAGVF